MQDAQQDSFEVSPQQEALWLAESEGPSTSLQLTVAIEGQAEPASILSALQAAVQRHEILRTTFVRQPGVKVPYQVVHSALPPAWRTVEIDADDQDAFSELTHAELAASFDHADGPLVRAVLVTRGPERHQLVLTLSGLLADAPSVPALVREFAGASAVEEPLQYADFAAWQRELAATPDPDAQAFWERAAAVPSPALPLTLHAGAEAFIPAISAIELDGELTATVIHAASGDLPAFVHAAWQALLHRLTGESSFATAFVSSEVRHADLEGAIGAFSPAVPLAAEIYDEMPFAQLAQAMADSRAQVVARLDRADVDAAGLSAGFVAHELVRESRDGVTVKLEQVLTSGRQAGVWLVCLAGEHALELALHFNPRAHDRDVIARLGRRLARVLASAAREPQTAIGSLELLDPAERTLVLKTFNATAGPRTSQPVHALIAAHAVSAPNQPAVVDEQGSLSYAELDGRANQLAHRLRRAGVGPDVVVGLCAERSRDMIVGLLGILKAGGAYLPLHYEHPPARLAHQLRSAGAVVVVAQESVRQSVPDFGGEVITLAEDALSSESTTPPEVDVTPENLVYVIYTSGSTGTPKGVGVTHANLANYSTAIARVFGADAEPQSFGAVTSISTDLGNTSVFGALCSGGTLVLISPAAAADPAQFARQLERTPVDVLKITPSHMAALLAGDDPRVLPRRSLVLGGERAPWDLVAKVRALAGCAIFNHYGPTEATVGACVLPVGDGPGKFAPATVPIGRPLANARCYVLDAQLHPVAIGSAGRLFLAGAGIARGYLGEPELTAERFLEDPFADGHMYDTGDLARWLPDGTLEFLGREDEQVKIRGYRVEPAEVEAALRTHERVGDAVVVVNGERLVAYCTVDGTVAAEELQRHLEQWLPEYMLPSAIVTLDVLPRTPSGKVDRRALPEPPEPTQATAEYVAPSTPVEQALAVMWSDVLGIERIGVADDFFELGGHSLLATQIVAQVRSDFAVELPLSSLFTSPTIQSLSSEIVSLMGSAEDEETAQLMSELEGLSDEEIQRLLAGTEAPER